MVWQSKGFLSLQPNTKRDFLLVIFFLLSTGSKNMVDIQSEKKINFWKFLYHFARVKSQPLSPPPNLQEERNFTLLVLAFFPQRLDSSNLPRGYPWSLYRTLFNSLPPLGWSSTRDSGLGSRSRSRFGLGSSTSSGGGSRGWFGLARSWQFAAQGTF